MANQIDLSRIIHEIKRVMHQKNDNFYSKLRASGANSKVKHLSTHIVDPNQQHEESSLISSPLSPRLFLHPIDE